MSQISKDRNGQPLPTMVGAFGTNYNLSVSGTSVATSAFAAGTILVRVAVGNADTGVFMAQGTAPTASTSTGILLPSGSVTYASVAPGQKLAFVSSGTTIPVTVTEIL